MAEQSEIQLLQCTKVDQSRLLFYTSLEGHSAYAIAGKWSMYPDYTFRIMMVIDDRLELDPQEIEIMALSQLKDYVEQLQAGDTRFK